MDKKEGISEEFSSVKKEIESYIQNRIDLTKLHLAEDLSRFVSGFIIKTILFYIGFFVLTFFSIAGAFAIGACCNSNEIGFISIASIYLFIGVVFYLSKRYLIQTPIIKSLIHLFFPNFNNYDKK